MLVCSACQTPGLQIVASLELGGDARWDERSIQLATCPACGTHFRAHYHEERRGARERVMHEAHPISAALFERLTEAIEGGKGAEAELLAAAEVADGERLAFESSEGLEALDRLSSHPEKTSGNPFARLLKLLKR